MLKRTDSEKELAAVEAVEIVVGAHDAKGVAMNEVAFDRESCEP